MKVSNTLDLIQGQQKIKEFIQYMDVIEPGKIPTEIIDVINQPDILKGVAGIGLGINQKTKEPIACVLINYKDVMSFLVGNEIIEIIEYVQFKMPEYDDKVVLAISFGFLHQLKSADFAKDWKMPEGLEERLKDNSSKFHEHPPKVMPKPTNESRELNTLTGTDALKMISKFTPNRDTFIKLTKNLLRADHSLAIMVKKPITSDEDVQYAVVFRRGEPTNDPQDADLVGMIAYQPEVLYNGIVFSPDVDEDVKEHFQQEYEKHFKF